MHEERFHYHGLASFSQTGFFSAPRCHISQLDAPEHTVTMAAGRHAQRAIRIVAIVEMKPDGEHFLTHRPGRASVVDAVFNRREIVARRSGALGEREHHVLMPRYFPICRGCLVEGDGLDRNRTFGKKSRLDYFGSEQDRGLSHDGLVEQTALSGAEPRKG